MKKLFALLLALLLLVGCSNGGGNNGGEQPSGNAEVTNQIIYGSTTELNGDLGNAWWGNNASDATVRELINDYSVITTDQGGELVENHALPEMRGILGLSRRGDVGYRQRHQMDDGNGDSRYQRRSEVQQRRTYHSS